jgi:hypothetical protein
MPGPWDKYAQAGPSEAPVIAPPDPYKQAAETRAQEDQALQREGAVRAREDQEFQRRKFELEQQRADRQEDKANAGTVDEKKIATLLTRIAGGANDIQAIAGTNPESQAPGLIESVRGDLMPGGIGGVVTRAVAGENRRSVHDAQRDILDAALTLGTGAAYNAEQLSGQMASYFPQYGDTPKEIEIKNTRLLRLIEAAKANAGPAWAKVEPAIAPFMQALTQPSQAAAQGGEDRENPWPGVVGEDGKPLGPDGGYGMDPETGEWALYGRVTDDSPAQDMGPDGKPRVTGNDPGYMQIAAGIGDVVQGGLNNTIGLLANPVNTNLFRAFGYDGYTSDIGQTAREGLGLPYGNETIGAINQAAAGGMSGAGAARGISNALLPGIGRNALAEYGSRPLLDTATGGTAAFSGEAARQMGAGPVGQAAATVLGGAAPSAFMGSRNALLNVGRGGNPPPDFDASVVRAGERQNIPVRLPDAVPSERGRMANAAQTPHAGPRISAARAADQDAVEARVQQIGGDGAARDNYALGTTVQRAADRHVARTRSQANRLYERARELAGDARVTPRNADAALDRHIQELRQSGENTNAGAIQYLEGLRSDIDRGLTIESMQNLRSNMRGQINGRNLTGTDTERRVRDVVEAMNSDLAEQLPEGAAQALDGADQFYRTRMEFIDQVSQRFIGADNNRVSAETAAQRLLSMVNGKGDAQRFGRMWEELEPAEQADLSATIAASLGRKANGEFSLSTLVRSLDPEKGINPRTARLVFGADGARALTDLRVIANAKTATQQGMNNSNTGATVTRAAGGFKTLVLGALGYSAGGPVGAAAGAMSRDVLGRLGEQRTARLLLNPNFTRWLRAAPNTSEPRVIDAYFRRLTTQAAKSPVLAGDVRALQESLAQAFAQSPGRAAAQQEDD